MPTLNEAYRLRLGAQSVDKVMKGSTEVWVPQLSLTEKVFAMYGNGERGPIVDGTNITTLMANYSGTQIAGVGSSVVEVKDARNGDSLGGQGNASLQAVFRGDHLEFINGNYQGTQYLALGGAVMTLVASFQELSSKAQGVLHLGQGYEGPAGTFKLHLLANGTICASFTHTSWNQLWTLQLPNPSVLGPKVVVVSVDLNQPRMWGYVNGGAEQSVTRVAFAQRLTLNGHSLSVSDSKLHGKYHRSMVINRLLTAQEKADAAAWADEPIGVL